MFEAWRRALYARRRLTLGITLVLVAFAAVWGTGVVPQAFLPATRPTSPPAGLGFAGTVATQQWLSGCVVEPLEETDLTSSLPDGGDPRVRLSIANIFDI